MILDASGKPLRGPIPRLHLMRVCLQCGLIFDATPRGRGDKPMITCSKSCGRKYALTIHGHPRGALGMKHNEETRLLISNKSKKAWASKTPEMRAEHSERTRLKFMGRRPTESTHTRAKGGRRADLNNRYFRSRWEANYARWLNHRIALGEVEAWDFEPRTFTFPVKRGTTGYTPDFFVTFPDGHSEWHEVKGWLTQQGATALKRFGKYYPEEKLVMIDEPEYKKIARLAIDLIENWE